VTQLSNTTRIAYKGLHLAKRKERTNHTNLKNFDENKNKLLKKSNPSIMGDFLRKKFATL